MEILPKIIRLRDVPVYLGTNKNYFNTQIRPYLTEIPIGDIGIGFDRLELDQWVEYTKGASGRPPKRRPPWEKETECQDLLNEIRPGGLTKQSTVNEYRKAREQVTSMKQSDTSSINLKD
jgi:hypothetical protein